MIFMICTAPDTIKMLKYRRLRGAKHVKHLAGMGNTRKKKWSGKLM